MNAEEAARQFAEQFPAVYRRFCRPAPKRAYQPTPESLAILQHLGDAGPLTVTEAARHMDRSQAAMSELLQRLVERGQLARMRDERDRRRSLVWLTEAGRRTVTEARRVLSEKRLVQAMAQMTPRQRAALVRALRALLDTDTHTDNR